MHPPFSFVVPGRPGSVNSRGVNYRRWKAKVNSEATTQLLVYNSGHIPFIGDMSVNIVHFHKKGNYADIDNIVKSTLDGMAKCVFDNDRDIQFVTSRRLKPALHVAVAPQASSIIAVADALAHLIAGEPAVVAIKIGPPPLPTDPIW